MLRICISGFTDSGKTTLGEMISKDLKIMHITKYVTDTYKSFKKAESKEDKDLRITQTALKDYANPFDDEVVALAAKNDCVVTTWLGPWLVKEPTLRIWLYASLEERIKRCSKEKKFNLKEAEQYVKKKDTLSAKAFKEVYGIDVEEHRDKFDLEINTERLSQNEIASMVSMLVLGREKQIFR